MKKMTIKRITAVILAVAVASSLLSGCSKDNEKQTSIEIDTETIAETIVETLQSAANQDKHEAKEEIVEESIEARPISTDWEDYVGDMETFTYGLLVNELSNQYDVFPAYVDLSNGYSVYGLGYTDYSECYTDEGENHSFFTAGFIPYCGELDISEEDFNSGLEIHNLDFEDDETSFLFTYESAPFEEHCVVYDNYLKYGVDETGHIFYESKPFSREICDTSLGTLYSYDEEKVIYEDNFGEYVPVTGESLSSSIDYDELENEINRILTEQDLNFATVDIESCAYFAQEAVTSYLLSLQEETFLGYDVDELVSIAKELDPVECIQLNKDGISTIDLRDMPNDTPQEIAKWLVGAGCICVAAVSLVASMVTVECPVLSSASSALMGTSIEIFMQVVIQNERLEDVHWNKVALAAATGAVSGLLGPYINAGTSGVGYFLSDSAVDGLIGGIEQTVSGYLDGKRGTDLAKSFGYGFAIGFALSAAFKGAGALISKGASKIANTGQKMLPNASKKVSSAFTSLKSTKSGRALTKFGNGITKLKEVADSSAFHSRHISKRLAQKQLASIITHGDDKLENKAFAALKKDDILDLEGNKISKDELRTIFDKAKDGEIIGHFKVDDEIVNIKKQNGVVGIVFDEDKFQTVVLDDFLTGDRSKNFNNAAKKYIEKWKADPSTIPTGIEDALKANDLTIDMLSVDNPEKLVEIVQKSGYVFHENIDGKSITLALRTLHDKTTDTGISHYGGVSLMKTVREQVAQLNFDRLVSAAASGAVIAIGGQ